MLTIATFFQELLRLSINPALHDWQSKHRVFKLLFHKLQSELLDSALPLVQFVGPTYVNWQSFDGLQQPDCNYT